MRFKDLMIIANKYGSIVVHPSMDWRAWGGDIIFPEVEIYDE